MPPSTCKWSTPSHQQGIAMHCRLFLTSNRREHQRPRSLLEKMTMRQRSFIIFHWIERMSSTCVRRLFLTASVRTKLRNSLGNVLALILLLCPNLEGKREREEDKVERRKNKKQKIFMWKRHEGPFPFPNGEAIDSWKDPVQFRRV